jgi:hypothetical protein
VVYVGRFSRSTRMPWRIVSVAFEHGQRDQQGQRGGVRRTVGPTHRSLFFERRPVSTPFRPAHFAKSVPGSAE